MQLQIDHLRRKLQQRETPSSLESPSGDDDDDSYRLKSRTPPSESFSCDEDCHYTQRSKSPSRKGLCNDAMSRALCQISKSQFTQRIKGRKHPWQLTQPMFTMYNGRIDPMDHVSHFIQKMAVHSKNEALICKVFPSSQGPVAMRWFDDLKESSINSFQELTRAFGAHFVTCSKDHRPLDSPLSMAM